MWHNVGKILLVSLEHGNMLLTIITTCGEFHSGNIKVYFHFLSFLYIEMAQVVADCLQGRPERMYPVQSFNTMAADHTWQGGRRAHDDIIKWKHFLRDWAFLRGIHRGPVNSPHKGQWRGALMFSLICVWINDWVNNREAGDLRFYCTHYDIIVMNGHGIDLILV